MYNYALLCTIPFIIRRNRNYLINGVVLALITFVFTTLSLILSPQYNIKNLLTEAANDKLLSNSLITFILFLAFAFIMIAAFNNVITALIKAKINANKQKDTKTRVLSNLGHELRTQLSSIHGITQLLLVQNEKGSMSKQTFSDYTDTLELCSKQMLFLVDDILDIHKIESGNFNLNCKPENIYGLLHQVVIPFKNKAEGKNLIFDVSIDPILKNDYLDIDSSRLTQVLQNLISNAIKYTDNGFIKFTVKMESENEEESSIIFSIKDSGMGISNENLLKIFDSFQQIRDKDTANVGGTGLGLSISKTIIEKMGSQINVNSIESVGSDFNFTLKLKKVPYLSQQNKDNNLQVSPSFLKGKKILVTEDNKISMLYASKLLEKNGAIVLKAYNGVEAVELVEANADISIVLLDLEMPVMNGFTTIQHIKEINNSLKVIAFTANIPDFGLLNRISKFHFDDFLAKPFKNDNMFSILNKHL
ncbi:ATP-binding protein [Xanthomarina sp. F1114]|uniref:hybrid sensor histidine kinase/response regulator n=1 Tax=Xanthomarina sp. F1114 TaxID=2996019 RepID=UPI00225E0762|nr:ATP-binding protein [Xanthomarina sp. F1114]MCX7546975.1 ATP-binding protein [Xanthomarina sp. F1114]